MIGETRRPHASIRADGEGAPNRRLRGATRRAIGDRDPNLGLTVATVRPSTATSGSPAGPIGATLRRLGPNGKSKVIGFSCAYNAERFRSKRHEIVNYVLLESLQY